MALIGIDIGGTHFRIGAVEEGLVRDFRKVPVAQVFSSPQPIRDLADYLKDYCRGKPAEAVSIGFPATLDAERKIVLQAPNVPFFEKLPVVEALSGELGIPVFIERDVTFALLYDCRQYGIPPRGIVCGFYFGTGVGNAISVNGTPLIGKNGTAGELGHIPVDGNASVCGCGNTGCLETVAGGKYLARLCDTVYADTPISQLFVRHGKEPLLLQFVDRMAMAVATEVNLLDPEHLLIGGGVPAMEGFPREYLRERILARTRKPFPAENLHILFTEDTPQKCILGAALYAGSRLCPENGNFVKQGRKSGEIL